MHVLGATTAKDLLSLHACARFEAAMDLLSLSYACSYTHVVAGMGLQAGSMLSASSAAAVLGLLQMLRAEVRATSCDALGNCIRCVLTNQYRMHVVWLELNMHRLVLKCRVCVTFTSFT